LRAAAISLWSLWVVGCLLPPFVAYAAAMSNLQSQLEDLTSTFIASLMSALRAAPIDDVIAIEGISDGMAPAAAPRTRAAAAPAPAARRTAAPKAAAAAAALAESTGKRHRASANEVQDQKKLAFDTAKTMKPGFSKGELMQKCGSAIDLGRALTMLVAEGRLRKQGERRMTRYWVK
jgi:hypothetical protein